MKRKPVCLITLLLLFVLSPRVLPARQVQQSGTIQGTITELQSGRPLPNAAISFSGSSTPIRGFTDGSGRFAFEGVPADEYKVSVSQDGYVWRKKESGPEMVTLKPGQELKDLALRLLKTSAISGRVVDENGRPLRVSVSLLRMDYRNGRRGFVAAALARSFRTSVSTNRNGEYRLYGLEPGEYYLRADLDGAFYYPGVSDPTFALPVTVLAGRDATADFKGNPIQKHTVTVELSANLRTPISAAGRPTAIDSGVWFTTPRDPSSLIDFSSLLSMRFTLIGGNRYQSPRLPPGAYELFFSQQQQSLFGHLVFDIKDRDEDLGFLTLTSGISLSGRVRLESFPVESMPIQVNLTPANGNSLMRSARPAADGTFTFLNVPEGNYWVTFTGMHQDAYIKSVRYGAVPGNADITIGSAPDGSLDIVLAKGGVVRGTVRNARGDGIPNGQVVVFPAQGSKQSPTLLKTAEADESGSFLIRGLAPGEFRALAWEDALPPLSRDSEFLAGVSHRTTRFTILQDSTATIDVPVLPPSN